MFNLVIEPQKGVRDIPLIDDVMEQFVYDHDLDWEDVKVLTGRGWGPRQIVKDICKKRGIAFGFLEPHGRDGKLSPSKFRDAAIKEADGIMVIWNGRCKDCYAMLQRAKSQGVKHVVEELCKL